MILDGDLIRRRRDELRVSQRQLASQIGATGAVIRGLEAGTNHTTVSVGLLDKLARALAIEPGHLFTARAASELEGTETDVGDDAATLGSALTAVGTSMPVSAVADHLGWERDRVLAAIDELARVLPRCGMQLRHVSGRLSIERAVEPVDRAQLEATVRGHLTADGLSVLEARLLHQVWTGGVPRELTNAEHVALGVLANAGLIEPGDAPKNSQAQRPWTLAAATAASTPKQRRNDEVDDPCDR